MGNWNMIIQGVGPHGNRIPEDIEQLYIKFLDEISATGVHTIVHSSVTSGGAYFNPRTIPPVKSAEQS